MGCAALLLLSACAVRDVVTLSPENAEATTQSIFFATQRDVDQLSQSFGEERQEVLRFGEITVSIPPNHEPGRIELRSATPDPARDFAVTAITPTTTLDAFVSAVQARQGDEPDETLVYIHGFNTTAAQAVFRLAQIQEDFGLEDPSVLFTWPSAARSTGYVYDRDSVLFARDDLVTVLSALVRNGHGVTIVAHSMGAHLTMEALRQARLTGNDRLLNRISGVVLMSPDIDVDVFRRQADAIGTLPQPFLVLATEQDRALGISSVLTGRPRLGTTIRAEDLQRDDITILDFSTFAEGQRFDHLVPVTSPTAIQLLRSLMDSGARGTQEFDDFLRADVPSDR